MNRYRCHVYEFEAATDSGAVATIRLLAPTVPLDTIKWYLNVKCNTGRYLPVYNMAAFSIGSDEQQLQLLDTMWRNAQKQIREGA